MASLTTTATYQHGRNTIRTGLLIGETGDARSSVHGIRCCCDGRKFLLILVLFVVSWGIGGMTRSTAAELSSNKDSQRLDYLWRPTRQLAILRAKTKVSHHGANGLALDTNGDWLLLTPAGIVVGDETRGGAVIWRSSDRGQSWSKTAVIPEDLPDTKHLKNYSHDYRQLLVTSKGRFVTYVGHWPISGSSVRVPHEKQGSQLGEDPPGRPRVAMANWLADSVQVSIAYSDDKGQTWRMAFVDGGPLRLFGSSCCGSLHEAANGELTFPVAGCLKEPGPWGWTPVTGYVRSSDGGETWSRPHVIFKDEGQRGHWFNETAVLPRNNGPWLAVARANPLLRVQKPGSHGFLGGFRSFSHDEGKTWTLPEPATETIAYPRLLELKDGGLLIAASRWGTVYTQFSYDNGHSCAYGLEVPRSGGCLGAWLHPDDQTVVAVHGDIGEKDLMLTYYTRQPTDRTITTQTPPHPEHRWTMRDLKNVYVNPDLRPYCSSARCPDGTIVVAGLIGKPTSRVIVISSSDPWNKWSVPVEVASASTYANIYPVCMTTTGDGTLWMVCTEADDPLDEPEIFPLGKDQRGTPTVIRTLVSRDSGQSWKQVAAMNSCEGLRGLRPGSRMVLDGDGQLVLPVSALDNNGRSVCGTLRWRGTQNEWSCYQEMACSIDKEAVFDHPAVALLGNGRWLGVFRAQLADYQVDYNNSKGKTLRQPPLRCTLSEDDGKTWTSPTSFCSAHYPHLLPLPDGALMLTDISGSHMQYRISYNRGDSWSFEDVVIHYPTYNLYQGVFAMSDLPVVVLDDHTLLGTYFANDAHEGGPRIVATWFRALPATSFEARERGL